MGSKSRSAYFVLATGEKKEGRKEDGEG